MPQEALQVTGSPSIYSDLTSPGAESIPLGPPRIKYTNRVRYVADDDSGSAPSDPDCSWEEIRSLHCTCACNQDYVEGGYTGEKVVTHFMVKSDECLGVSDL